MHAVVGFDAFIDSIIHVVGTRRSMEIGGYDRIATIGEFASRAAAAAGKSTNLELVVLEERFGGNGPLMAGALGSLGAAVTYLGAVGEKGNPGAIHPAYREFAARCRMVIPLAPPALTDALEFDDGKIMLGKPANIQSVTWPLVVRTVGLDQVVRLVESSSLLGMVNWVMMAGLEGIWAGLCEEVFPRVADPRSKRIFIDLCDPAKRTDEDIRRAVGLLERMNEWIPLMLGLNQAEAERLAAALGVDVFTGSGMGTQGSAVRSAAEAIRSRTGLEGVVIHPRRGAAAATSSGESAWFDGPFTRKPRLSTGAGDHFNAGFAAGWTLGLAVEECLAIGCASSGAYVRDAKSPDAGRLVEFLRALPPGEDR